MPCHACQWHKTKGNPGKGNAAAIIAITPRRHTDIGNPTPSDWCLCDCPPHTLPHPHLASHGHRGTSSTSTMRKTVKSSVWWGTAAATCISGVSVRVCGRRQGLPCACLTGCLCWELGWYILVLSVGVCLCWWVRAGFSALRHLWSDNRCHTWIT